MFFSKLIGDVVFLRDSMVLDGKDYSCVSFAFFLPFLTK